MRPGEVQAGQTVLIPRPAGRDPWEGHVVAVYQVGDHERVLVRVLDRPGTWYSPSELDPAPTDPVLAA